MANDLSNIASALYTDANIIAREPHGFQDSVSVDFDDKGAALNENIEVPYAGASSVSDFTPAMVPTAGTDSTANVVAVTIDNSKQTSHNLTGEQIRSLENAGTDRTWMNQKIKEMMRALRNSHESNIWTKAYQGASLAIGTAGTNPFSSNDIEILADVLKVMKDNGAPGVDLQCVVNTTAFTTLIKEDIIKKADMYGSDEARRTARLNDFYGFQMGLSAQIGTHTKGTGTSYQTDNAEAVGQTTISVDTGSGTIIAGDVVTHAQDSTNKYVVNTALAGGSFVIGRPGLKVASNDNSAITVGDNYTANVCFERAAVITVERPPIIPENPTIKRQLISDINGYTYLLLEIAGYGMKTWELHNAFGSKVINPQFVINLLG